MVLYFAYGGFGYDAENCAGAPRAPFSLHLPCSHFCSRGHRWVVTGLRISFDVRLRCVRVLRFG